MICIPECIVLKKKNLYAWFWGKLKWWFFFHLLYILKPYQIYLPSIVSLIRKIVFSLSLQFLFIYLRVPFYYGLVLRRIIYFANLIIFLKAYYNMVSL